MHTTPHTLTEAHVPAIACWSDYKEAVCDLADRMSEEQAGEIITWTDEPELLAEPGETIPTFHPVLIAAARMRGEMDSADLFGRH